MTRRSLVAGLKPAVLVPLALTGLAALTAAPAHAATTIVAPPSLAATNGNAQLNTAPFNDPSRYQQIYDASQFSALSGPEKITQIAFRPSANQTTSFSNTFNAIVSLSTTTQTVAGLSATYANNIGANNTVVFNGPLTLSSAGHGAGATPGPFDIIIPLTTPFLYDPSHGNLLFDFTNVNGGFTGFVDANSDAAAAPLTRLVFTDNGNSATGNSTAGTVQAGGAVTQFTFQPAAAVPEPSALALLALGLLPLGVVARKRLTR